MALDRHEQLVLGRGEADRARLRLAPVQQPAQAGAERQQVLEVRSRHFGHSLTVAALRPWPPLFLTDPAPHPAREYIVLRFSPVGNRLACPPGPVAGLTPAGKPSAALK